ncbi:MAG: PLP-dependent aminotransferase family protein [Thermoproteota archaeon]|nr:PLP-dependent aminotransferase family protein [Candidatus Brockarchaeota archaeon]MBO3767710.1 PLP-dependent aminotransferase family protein [Candidatus Brockarchaeota archaeon]MBO3801178.1 PLP-dependent aminotransferase family protein [Candidatus Brockarchaeota archaeon]
MNYEKFYASRVSIMRPSDIRELLKWSLDKSVISFAGGLPDPKLLPKSFELEGLFEYLMMKNEYAFQYGETEGVNELKKEVIRFSKKYGGINANEDEVIITTGSQQALDIVSRLFIDRGNYVIVELPTYLAALQVFNLSEPQYVGIPMDDNGMRTDTLERKLKELNSEGISPKFVYTVPTCQNPSGTSMTVDRRRHLLELASKYDFLIIEDDPYGYITFGDEKMERIKAMDNEGRVIYLSTFSKIFSPGLRVGWAIANEELIRSFAIAKQGMDLSTSPVSQYIALFAMEKGIIEKRIPILIREYKKKRDIMLQSLEDNMPKETKWTKPIGGMFVFVWLKDAIDTKLMLEKAIKNYKVSYVPGKSFFVDGTGKNTMRLNFSYPSEEQIREGIHRLSNLIKAEYNNSF